jgi:hypothetical protein
MRHACGLNSITSQVALMVSPLNAIGVVNWNTTVFSQIHRGSQAYGRSGI